MKIIHRISFRASPAKRRQLEALGVKVPAGITLPGEREPFVAFDLEEGHPHWGELEKVLRRWDAFGVVRTEFSKAEVERARWLALEPRWHHGYPQPKEDEFGFRDVTYDLKDYCEECGIGWKQKAPFQMKGEPTWGRNGILQLNWVFDEYFATPEVWRAAFEPNGVESRVVTDRKGAVLETVVQLTAVAEVVIDVDGLPSEKCSRCGRKKYLPVARGRFPALRGDASASLVRTREWFGSGASAHQGILVSQTLARELQHVRGVGLVPTEPEA
ncbi:MAG TPA: hypothetical protein VM686_03405 [Polyangiaceae bacterium]|nr:hypothetical protein [Polyangiaceae bacterium]